MAPRYRHGEIIAYRPDLPDTAGCIGREAIIEAEDGGLYLKVLQPGAAENAFVLVSVNPSVPPMVNIRVRAAYRIDWHQP
jgi:phage repressor protein C with HTH and peptisase S24 domain